MEILVVVLALITNGGFGQAQLDGQCGSVQETSVISSYNKNGINIDEEMFTCMSSCMCDCVSERGLWSALEVPSSNDVCDAGPIEATTAKSGYTYTLKIERDMTSTPSNDVVYTDPINGRYGTHDQDIIYYKAVDVDNPLWVDGTVERGKKVFHTFPRSDPLNICEDQEDGSWEKAALVILTGQILPNGSCPVAPGTYLINRDTEVTVTFNEMLKCGDYEIFNYIDTPEKVWAGMFVFKFTIPDDGSCIPDESQ